MSPPPTLDELIRTVQTDAPSDNPLDQLATAATTINLLTETGDSVLGHFVDKCRGSGHTWTEISQVLGVTKQAVHKRFSLTAGSIGPTMERFTDRARHVLKQARNEADDLGHAYIGTEHLLLAHFVEPDGLAGKILAKHKIARKAVEASILTHTSKAPVPHTEAPYTPRLKSMLEGAVSEALDMGHNYIGTEHLLLAFYREPKALGTKILVQLGAEEASIRADVVELLSGYREK